MLFTIYYITYLGQPDRTGAVWLSASVKVMVKIGRVDQKLTRAENLQKCSLLYTISHISVSLAGPGPFGYQPRLKLSWSRLGVLTENWPELTGPGLFGYQPRWKSWPRLGVLTTKLTRAENLRKCFLLYHISRSACLDRFRLAIRDTSTISARKARPQKYTHDLSMRWYMDGGVHWMTHGVCLAHIHSIAIVLISCF